MAKIRIEDLPEELEKLTPEELQKILGAGRRSVPLGMETLEARVMLDAALGHALPNVQPTGSGDAPHVAHVRTLKAQAPGLAVDYAKTIGTDKVWGAAEFNKANQGGGPTQAGDITLKFANGYYGLLHTSNDGTREVNIYTPDGARVFRGVEGTDGRYKVEWITLQGDSFFATYDKYGGQWNENWNVWTPHPGQKILEWTRILAGGKGTTVGAFQPNGTWREITTGSNDFKTRTEIFDKPGGTLQYRETIFADHTFTEVLENGKWVETTKDLNGVMTRQEVFDNPGGTLLRRTMIFADHTTVTGVLENGKWVETIKDSNGIMTRRQVSDRPDGIPIQIDEYTNNDLKKTTINNANGTKTVITFGGQNIIRRTEVLGWSGRSLVVQERLTEYSDGRVIRGVLTGDGKWQETSGTLNNGVFVKKDGVGARTEVYDKADGKLLERTTVQEKWVESAKLRDDGKWVLTVTYNPGSDVTKMVDIIDRLDGNQTLFAREIYYKNGRVVHGEGKVDRATNQGGPWTVMEYTGKVEVLKDGRLKVDVKDGFQIYERSGTGWRLTQHNRLEAGSWIEETWSLDGKTYTKDVWSTQNHGAAEGKDHLYQVVAKDGKMTVTHYRLRGLDVRWGYTWGRTDGRDGGWASWTYTLDANGQPGELVEYNAYEPGSVGGWHASWKQGRPDNIGGPPTSRAPGGPVNVRGRTLDFPPGFQVDSKTPR
jgi:hypothetical protein